MNLYNGAGITIHPQTNRFVGMSKSITCDLTTVKCDNTEITCDNVYAIIV